MAEGGVKKVKYPGTIIASNIRWADQCALTPQKNRGEIYRLKTSLFCPTSEGFIPLYWAAVSPNPE